MPQAPRRSAPKVATFARIRTLLLAAWLLVLTVLFQVISNNQIGSFLSLSNLNSLAGQAAIVAMLTGGMVLLMRAGHVDLSVGGVFGCTAMVFALLHGNAGWPWFLMLPVAVLLGALLGGITGALVGLLGLPSLLVSLAALVLYRNAVPILSGGRTVVITDPSVQVVANNGVPILIAVAVLGGLVWWARNRSRSQHPVLLFALMGALAALAAVIQAARVTAVAPSIGKDLEITVIAAAVAGGAMPGSARGTRLGAVLAAVLVASLQNGLALAGAGAEWQGVVLSAVLVLGLLFNVLLGRKPGVLFEQ